MANSLSLLSRNKQDLNRYIYTNFIEKQVLHILEHVVKNEGQKANYFFIDAVLLYLPGQDYPRKAHHETKEEEESPLELELEALVEAIDREETAVPVQYTPLAEQLMPLFSYSDEMNQQLYSGTTSIFSYDSKYESPSPANDTSESVSADYETAATEEAREHIEAAKYDFESSIETDEKFDNWVKFNPALFSLFKYLNHLNDDTLI